jgi:hypothetical protein
MTQLLGAEPKPSDEYFLAANKFEKDRKPGQAVSIRDQAMAPSPRLFNALKKPWLRWIKLSAMILIHCPMFSVPLCWR